MKLAATIIAGLAIYGLSGYAAWWVNHKLRLGSETPTMNRWSIRAFVALVTFLVVSFPLVFALEPVLG